jgi:hypothetical protein
MQPLRPTTHCATFQTPADPFELRLAAAQAVITSGERAASRLSPIEPPALTRSGAGGFCVMRGAVNAQWEYVALNWGALLGGLIGAGIPASLTYRATSRPASNRR